MRGLNTKLTRLFVDSFDIDYQIVVFTETWLGGRKQVLDSEIMCSDYRIFRKDRRDRSGGGVLIAAKSCLPSEEIISEKFLNIEFVAVYIKLNLKALYVTCSYIPPGSSSEVYDSHIDAIKYVVTKMGRTDSIIVLGDFNLPRVSWHSLPESQSLIPLPDSDQSTDILNSLTGLNLFQLNHIINSRSRILDLMWVDDPSKFEISRVDPITLPEDRYHPTLGISCSFPHGSSSMSGTDDKSIFCFKRADYAKLNSLLLSVDWLTFCNGLENNIDFDDLLRRFYDILYSCFLQCVPKIPVRIRNGPPWDTRELSRLKNLKSKYFKKYKKSGLTTDFSRYAIARSSYNVESRKAYGNYLGKIKENFSRDPKSFYRFVNSKRNSSSYPTMVRHNGVEFSDDLSISNAFADFFASTYSDRKFDFDSPYPFDIRSANSFGLPMLDISTVLTDMRRLKKVYDAGPDGVPSSVLRFCSEALALPLTFLFNASLKMGYFPSFWKKSFLIPLHKSGSLINVSNYRGIAKLSAIPKLFEKLVTDIISHHVSSILVPCQHGFRKGRSTATNLVQFTSGIIRGFVSGLQTDAIYTDFSKAFDKVNHDLLLYKLSIIGFNDNVLKWLSSYLKNRVQCVQFKQVYSHFINVPSGVPQGSHLGPILFLLFINDLPTSILHSEILMFADDVKIFMSFRNPVGHLLLQEDLEGFSAWCNCNLMELNLGKCKHMSFARSNFSAYRYWLSGEILEVVESIIDLGILMDRKLEFKAHILTMVNKAYGVLGFMKRWAKEFSDPYTTKQLFISLVRPILEYGSVVWDPQYNVYIDKIESVQKQFLLFCLRNLGWSSDWRLFPAYPNRLALIRLPTLKSRRVMLNTLFVLKIINGDVDSEFLIGKLSFNVPFYSTRRYSLLYTDFHRTNYGCSDPMYIICTDFNSLFEFVDFCGNYATIKSRIITHLNSLRRPE